MSASFVSQLYQNILGREPDASGLAFWREMIEYGGISAAKMTEQFISSAEYKVHVQPIAQLYFVTFDRAPEAVGLDFWIKAHRDGVSLDVIATAFSQADEFEAKYGQMDDGKFITSLYLNALRREPDEAGQAYWSAQLSAGLSRAALLNSFSVAPETIELRAQEVDFALLYLALTGQPPTMAMIREAVPIRDWLNVIESIYTSPDYVGPDVPGLQRFVDPETQPETPVELPIVVVPQPDPDLVADTTPPEAPSPPDLLASSDTGYLDTDNLTNDSTPTFTGTAESGSTVTLYANGQTVGTGVANGGNWSITSSALASGTYSITATATDAAGNVSAASNGLDVTIDTVAPTATIAAKSLSIDTGSSSTDFVTSAASQTISGTLTQALGADESVQVSLDNGLTWSTATVSNTNWTLSNQTLVGSSALIASVVDTAGNAGTAFNQNYVLDETIPVISNLRVLSDTELAFESSEPGTARLMDLSQILMPVGLPIAINAAATAVSYSVSPPNVATAARMMVVDVAGNASYDNDTRIELDSDAATSITGTVTADYIFGFGGDDSLVGLDGNDVLVGGDGDDTLVGGPGRDTLWGGDGFDTVSYADVVSINSHGLIGLEGMYITIPNGYADYIYGGIDFSLANQRDEFVSIEAVIGSGLADMIILGSDGMYADGGDGDDIVVDGDGNDTIIGGNGDDRIFGLGGDDTINGGAGHNTVIVGFGQDTVVHDTLGAAVDVQIQGPGLVTIEAREQGLVARRAESITQGTPQTTSVDASRSIADVRIDGLAANDSLIGGSGDDTISSAAGMDTIWGGRGRDSISGGQGHDLFMFEVGDSGVTTSTADIITDFSGSEGDRIGCWVVATPNIGYQEVADASVTSVESAVTKATAVGFLGAGNLSHVFVAGQVDGYLVSDLDNDGAADSVVVLTAKNQLGDFESSYIGIAAPTVSTPDLSPVSDSGASDDDNITSNNMPLFTGTAQVNSTVKLYADGVLIDMVTATGGQWNIVSPVALTEGSHVITATATDAAGTVSDESSGLTIIIDTTSPAPVVSTAAFSVDSGANATDFVTNEPSQTITGTLSRTLAAGETVQVSLDHGSTWTTATIAAGQTGWSLANQTLSGSQLLQVRVIDEAGNQVSAFSQFYVLDTQIAAPSAPDLIAASDTGDSNTDNVTGDNTPTFEGTAEVDAIVEVFADGISIGSVVAASGNWSITSSTLADGVYTITAQATDIAGNVSAMSTGLDVTIATSAPDAVVNNMWLSVDTGSSPSDFVTNTASQTISGLLTQALGANDSVQVSVDNGVTWSTATVSGTNWTVTNQTLVGSNTAVARVVGAAGNFSTAYSRNYVLEQIAPTISSFDVTGEETLSFVSSEDGTAGLLPVPGQDPFYFAIPPITANQPVTMVLSWAVNVLAEYLEVRDIAGNYSNSSETIFRGSPSGDVVTGTAGDDFMFGFEGNDNLSGGAGNDVLQAGSGADTLTGGSGADTLTGGADNDVFIYSSIAELFSGSNLVDSIVGGNGVDTIEINGELGFTISATDSFSRANSIETITISGQDHEYNMSLTLNADAFIAGMRTISFAADENSMAQNTIDASRANANQHLLIVGSASADAITAGAGNDTITGGAGADWLSGGDGDDQFQFVQIDHFMVGETIEGGSGVDVLEFAQAGLISFDGRDVTGIERLSVLAGGLNTVTLTQGTGIAELTGFDREDSQFYLTKHLTSFDSTKVNSASDVSAPGQWTTAKQDEDFVVTYWDEILGQAVNLVLDGVYNIGLFDPSIISQSGDLALQYQYVGA